MRTYNDEPRPRVLLEDLEEDVAERVRKLVPTSRVVSAGDQLYEPEFDVLVTSAPYISRKNHLHVVAFGAKSFGEVEPPTGGSPSDPIWPSMRVADGASLATKIHIPDNITGELGALVQAQLVPLFTAQEKKFLMVWGRDPHSVVAIGADLASWCTPFVIAGDGNVLAASFRRRGGGRCWVLPANCPDPEAWVAIALKEFRSVDPERVPALPEWWEQATWATTTQRVTRTALRELKKEREQLLSDLDNRLVVAQEDVNRADESAAEGAARLLTGDGAPLVNAVKAALESFGFEVDDMDDHFPEGRRREDLRVRDPDVANWEAIVEIKGYGRGASVNDLARITRWAMLYSSDHKGRLPNAQWHIVNAFRGLDPEVRPLSLPDDNDLRDFTEDGGLLIDTRQLFEMLRDVSEGVTDAKILRDQLRSARGRWTNNSWSRV